MTQEILYFSKYYKVIHNENILSRIIQINVNMKITAQAPGSLNHKKKKYVTKLEMTYL